MPKIIRITVDSFNDTIDIDFQGIRCLMSWKIFVEETNCPFDLENLFYINYEPDRNMYFIEKRGGLVLGGKEIPEIIWIESNYEAIRNFAEKYKPEEPVFTIQMRIQEYLLQTDWMVIRHKEQLELGVETSLDNDQYNNLLSYRQYLRDYDIENGDINNIDPPSILT